MCKINYCQTATVSVSYDVDLDPADYLDYDSEEAVEAAILEFMCEDVDYGDCDLDEVENDDVFIPEKFWEEWHKLKAEND